LRGDDFKHLLGTDYRLAFGADRARSKLGPGGFPIDSPPPYGVSPCGHGTFVPVQTTYKPSVVLKEGRKEGGNMKEISLRRERVKRARCGLPGVALSEAWAITPYLWRPWRRAG
jgi:hypothetical protein